VTLPQPICLPCWRTDWPDGGMNRDPPRVSGWPKETCCLCARPTNNGIYVRVDPTTVPFPQACVVR
jgi:hypothetical protein